ncbi:MAG: hypothetical protein U5K75_02275 [Ahrensia sp.]|nr:hypothetical protein [Ahrensia sp.]
MKQHSIVVKNFVLGWSPMALIWKLPTLDVATLEAAWAGVKSLFNWSPMAIIASTFGGIAGTIGGAISAMRPMWQARLGARLTSVLSNDTAIDAFAARRSGFQSGGQQRQQTFERAFGARAVDISAWGRRLTFNDSSCADCGSRPAKRWQRAVLFGRRFVLSPRRADDGHIGQRHARARAW